MRIRPMCAEDTDRAAEMEQLCFPDPWSRQSFAASLSSPDVLFLAAEENGVLTGYAGLQQSFETGDILQVAVHPGSRRQGIGEKLLHSLIAEGQKRGISSFLLEVRVSNQAARKLYAKLGFQEIALRKGFYTHPSEDACTMLLEVDPPQL